jgi:hypothetical protein
LEYRDFLKLPDISKKFEEMFAEQKKYFHNKCSRFGILGENLEAVSIKMAFITTDIYFSEIHRGKYQ